MQIQYVHVLINGKIKILIVQNIHNLLMHMQVRGAPAIAIVGCLSLASELLKTNFNTTDEMGLFVKEKLDYLVTARPTAVNMGKSASHYKLRVKQLQTEKDLSVENFRKM